MTATALRRSPPRTRKAVAKKNKVASVTEQKSGPMSFRMDVETRALVDRAASVSGQNRTEFMLTTLREKATEILLNQRLFALNESDWTSFVSRLDNPPPPNAKLKALLAEVPLWDKE